jgi:ribose-phosphate pyrophosphokinase
MALRAKDEVIIFSGNSNPTLAEEICRYLGTRLASATIGRFSDGEIAVEITENVRGGDVFVVQSLCPPTNDHVMELLLMQDALRRASAGRMRPCCRTGYARQDGKSRRACRSASSSPT